MTTSEIKEAKIQWSVLIELMDIANKNLQLSLDDAEKIINAKKTVGAVIDGLKETR